MNTQSILKPMRLIAAVATAALLTACASKPDITSMYDDSVDFGQFNTYNFFDDAGPDHGDYQSLFSQYMVAAITRELEARGYTKSDNPDLLVNFNAHLQDKTKITETPSMGMTGYYGYRGGFYDPWMGYGYGTDVHVSQYTEGTFNIDLVDASRMKLVWEGVGIGRVTEDSRENLKEKIDNGVALFFAQYPFQAGSGTPVPTEE